MPVSYSPVPYPIPTPYQSPAQGGNPYVTPGQVGVAIPNNIQPVYGPQNYGQTEWTNGMVTSSGGGNLYKLPTKTTGKVAGATTQNTPPPQDTNSGGGGGGGGGGAGGSDPEKLPGWNQRGEFVGQEVGSDGGIYGWTGSGWKFLRPEDVPQGPSDAELNAAYSPIFDYLNQAEGGLKSAFERQNSLYDTQEANRIAELGADKDKTLTGLNTSKSQSEQRKEDVITSARRLFNELNMANRQRFGGATSAGQAASELQSMEFQRSTASAQRAFEETQRELSTKEVEVNTQFALGQQKIKESIAQAKDQAFSDFQNGLIEIARQRASTESEKAQRKLASLEQYRQQLFQLQVAEQQYNQQLAAWKYQQDYQLAIYKQQLGAAQSAGQSAVSKLNNSTTVTPSTQLSVGSQSRTQAPIYTGQINRTKEELTGFAPALSQSYDPYNQFGSMAPIQYSA